MNSWDSVLSSGRAGYVEFGRLTEPHADMEFYSNYEGTICSLLYDKSTYYLREFSSAGAKVVAFSLVNSQLIKLWETPDPSQQGISNIFIGGEYLYKDSVILDKNTGSIIVNVSDRYEELGIVDSGFCFIEGSSYYRQLNRSSEKPEWFEINIASGSYSSFDMNLVDSPIVLDGTVIGKNVRGLICYSLSDKRVLWEFALEKYTDHVSKTKFSVKRSVFVLAGEWVLMLNAKSGKLEGAVKYTETKSFLSEFSRSPGFKHKEATHIATNGSIVLLSKLNLWGYIACVSFPNVDDILWCKSSKRIGYTCIAGDYAFTTIDNIHQCLELSTGGRLLELGKTSLSNQVMATDDYICFYQYNGDVEFFKFVK